MSPKPKTVNLQTALALAAFGLRVFPVIPDTKRPAFSDNLNRATTDQAILREWWQQWPNSLPAVVAGATDGSSGPGVIFLDEDEPGAIEGLEMVLGELHPTLQSRSMSGKRHLWFQWPAGVRIPSRVRSISPGVAVDVRGCREDGSSAGYIVFGGWADDAEPFVLDHPAELPLNWLYRLVFTEDDRAHLATHGLDDPRKLAAGDPRCWAADAQKLLTTALAAENGGKPATKRQAAAWTAYIRKAITGEADNLRQAVEGTRDQTANDAAIKLRGKLKGGAVLGMAAETLEILEAEALDALTTALIAVGDGGPDAEAARMADKWRRAHVPALPFDLRTVKLSQEVKGADLFGDVVRATRKSDLLSRLDLQSFADIKEERLQWLWKGRIPRGKLTLMAGLGGMGKSTILYDMAARISTGAEWPDGAGIAPQGNVILLNREDGAGDTIKPRLRAAGANMGRVHIVNSVKADDGHKRSFSIADDLELLQAAIEHLGNVQLVVFDPLSSYFGNGVNTWHESDVRAVLEPMTQLIERLGASVIGNAHLGKSRRQGDANMQVLNSVGIVNLARFVNMVSEEEPQEVADDALPKDEVRLFGPTKHNVAKRVPTLRYIIRGLDGDDEISRIDWIGTTRTRVGDRILDGSNGRGGRKEVDRKDAEFIVRELLANGPMRSRDLDKHCRMNDIKPRTWRRARETVSVSFKKGPEWYVALPDWEKQKSLQQAKHEARSAQAKRELQKRADNILAQDRTSEDW